jgi:hypothetical protein
MKRVERIKWATIRGRRNKEEKEIECEAFSGDAVCSHPASITLHSPELCSHWGLVRIDLAVLPHRASSLDVRPSLLLFLRAQNNFEHFLVRYKDTLGSVWTRRNQSLFETQYFSALRCRIIDEMCRM